MLLVIELKMKPKIGPGTYLGLVYSISIMICFIVDIIIALSHRNLKLRRV